MKTVMLRDGSKSSDSKIRKFAAMELYRAFPTAVWPACAT